MRTVSSILIALAVVACGGGGGGNGGPTSPNNPGPGPGPGNPSSSASVSMQSAGDGYGGTVWSFNPASVTITRGGTVTWTNGLNETHNVVFAPAAGAPQNVPEHQSGSNSRTFSTSGTFSYQCTIHPMSGQVVVQ